MRIARLRAGFAPLGVEIMKKLLLFLSAAILAGTLFAATGPVCAAEGASCAAKNCCSGLICGSGDVCAKPPTAISGVYVAVSDLCEGTRGLLPVAGMLMILVGAVTYAAGQMMGAETRARANVWATAALTGALIAMLISAVAPEVLKITYGSLIHC
jgi:hypothetical protein